MEQIVVMPGNAQEYSLVIGLLERMRIAFVPTREPISAQKEAPLRRMTMEEYYAEIDAAEADFQAGRFISHTDLKKEMKTWL